ncbi:receptor-like protein EIX2 isoform X1 [Lactuca sativa]|uniref:receptor-like protein EIX2 isoform X1 n=1 Tax=Lactuca sativa TaxID=4236 RepID=UPI000CD93C0F|nr:receptor-like protein EIX2 isoform X1 [Lactuca sativa]
MKALITLVTFSFYSSCLWLLFASSLCTLCSCNQNSDHIQCISTERLVLIQFKNNLVDHSNRLSSWSGDNCCSWSGVVCDNFTHHVQELRLRGPDDDEREEATKQMLGGIISPSLIKLEQLQYLDLSCNDFEFSPIPSFIGSFQNLRYLNISMSQFGGEVPHQLGNLSELLVLDLHDDPMLGNLQSENLKWIEMNLKRLQYLDMSGINLTGASDHWLQAINSLPSLQELHFCSCGLSQIPSDPTRVSFTSINVLDLSYNNFNGLLPGWVFSLHDLVSLDLTGCFIGGLNPGTRGGFNSMPSLTTLRVFGNNFVNSSSILNSLPSLSNLHYLDAGNCNLTDPILCNLQIPSSNIVHLDLSNNQIVEVIPKSLGNLCNLTTLDLQYNKFFGDVSELLERFCECESPKLELLSLRGNYLTGRLPEKIGRLKNLVSIDIAYNRLTGILPRSLGSLSLLQTLQLNTNQLEGWIPDSVGDLSSLKYFDLSYNKLNGSLPKSIGKLGKLSFLTLHRNSLTGIVTEDHFANLTDLDTLWVGDNKLAFDLVNTWIPPFQLNVLSLGSCNLGPRFPLWVQSQTSLEQLDLANANISDTIPNWIWSSFSSLTFLNISHNNIVGKLGDVSVLPPGAVLDLSSNHFSGGLPRNFNKPDLDFLDLSYNNLSGSLDQFLCDGIQESRQLRVLNLANNNMSGGLPNCWMNWESLVILSLEKNKLSGKIPSSLGNIPTLESLDMGNNKLSNEIPMSLLNSKSLLIVELAENELTGRIPTSIGRNDASLKILSLRSNGLEGEIPSELCRLASIQILDLADNNLSGYLPKCFTNFSVISGKEKSSPIVLYDALFQNQLLGSATLVTKGRVSSYSTILYLVTTLDLSDNKFSGSIPDELMALSGLRYLNLSQNQLTGNIPNTFDEMRELESLDLSVNHLDGKIPLSLAGLTALSLLNVSYNNLTGTIPTGRQLQTFNEFSFIGNHALCGVPLPGCRQKTDDTKGANHDHGEPDGTDWILVICIIVGLAVGFWITIGTLIVSKRFRDAYYHFLDETEIKLANFILLVSIILKTSPKNYGQMGT